MTFLTIVDLTLEQPDLIEQAAQLLFESFRGRTRDWQDIRSAREEALESIDENKISRVSIDMSGGVVGWIGATSDYHGNVWETHPLVVSAAHRNRGIARALVRDLEAAVRLKGALTLYAGTDDENAETTLADADLYEDVPGAIRNIRNLHAHPYEFYLRLGFKIVGVLPDANGAGKPDIFVAKRVG